MVATTALPGAAAFLFGDNLSAPLRLAAMVIVVLLTWLMLELGISVYARIRLPLEPSDDP
jgi:hypothetical protein